MPIININGKEISYEDNRVIDFSEGLIGMPNFRRAVFVESEDCAPFGWLASTESDVCFIVVNPADLYEEYDVDGTPGVTAPVDGAVLSLVKVNSDWQKTTVNLRAPIFVDHASNRGSQVILTGSDYKLEEALPQK